jgi:glycine oxidase
MKVIVAGRGLAGLAAAWRLAQDGHTVTAIGPDGRDGAGRVAAGRLAPICELDFGEEEVFHLGAESNAMWPGFAAQLGEASGVDVGFEPTGMVMVARDGDDAAVLDRLAQHRERLNLGIERLNSRAVRRLEPALGPNVRGGLHVTTDHAVDPRAVVAALHGACRSNDVTFVDATVVAADATSVTTRVARPEWEPEGQAGPPRVLHGDAVVLAPGAWAGDIDLGPRGPLPIRPVKGQILRLRFDDRVVAPSHVIDGLSCYMVPRRSGELVLGASVEEQGFDPSITAGAVRHLLDKAWEIVPAIDEMTLTETSVGFRPTTPDNGPLLGTLGTDGPIVVGGLYRHGVLLTPLVAKFVADLVSGRTIETDRRHFSPDRFTEDTP